MKPSYKIAIVLAVALCVGLVIWMTMHKRGRRHRGRPDKYPEPVFTDLPVAATLVPTLVPTAGPTLAPELLGYTGGDEYGLL